MLRKTCLGSFTFLFVFPLLASAQTEWCRDGEGATTRQVGGVTVQLIPFHDAKQDEDACRAVIRSQAGGTIFHVENSWLTINDATGKDVNNDGTPDLVIEGYSGGAHCCWTYWIVSLGESPGLARKICNERTAAFADLDGDGTTEIETVDGAFDYFDDLSHAETPFPLVVFRLKGKVLRRVNAEFWPLYHKTIDEARAELTPEKIAEFKQGKKPATQEALWRLEKTKGAILTIVLAYLYGGHENNAWKALNELWPVSDAKRIRNEILKTAGRGFLGPPEGPSFGCLQ